MEKFKFNIDSITTPTHVMIDYLKRTSYNTEKELYVIGSNYMKNELRMAGFKLAEEDVSVICYTWNVDSFPNCSQKLVK